MTSPRDIRARLQLRAGADAGAPTALWAGELRALLRGVQDHSSLHAAADELGMQYRQAWRVVKRAEALFATALTERRVGGHDGGGSSLTADGLELLRRLNRVIEDMGRSTADAFRVPLDARPYEAAGDIIVLASSTEPAETGLLDRLEEAFREDTGIIVRHIAAGSGQAHALAEHGRADVVLSHAPALEAGFMERGIGSSRTAVMRNRYLILGPATDPAGLARMEGSGSLADMFSRIASTRTPFVSRNDNSGTNLKERGLWQAAGVVPDPSWYHTPLEAGGSAAAVRCALRLGAYTLVDSATASRHTELRRFTPYAVPAEDNVFSVLVVDADHVPGANTDGATRLASWLGTERARHIIASFGAPTPLFEPA
ncbi:MAG: substrate-binding domain-containing protein [Spirochaetaceae bacterium]